MTVLIVVRPRDFLQKMTIGSHDWLKRILLFFFFSLSLSYQFSHCFFFSFLFFSLFLYFRHPIKDMTEVIEGDVDSIIARLLEGKRYYCYYYY